MYLVEMRTEHSKLADNSGIVARLFRYSGGAFHLRTRAGRVIAVHLPDPLAVGPFPAGT